MVIAFEMIFLQTYNEQHCFSRFYPTMIGGIFFSIQLIQIDLSQMKWNKLFSLFFMKRQLKQPFGEMSTSIFNQFTFMTRRAKSRTNEQQVQVFMSLTSVSNISQLKIKEKIVLQLLLLLIEVMLTFLLKERKRHKMKILKFRRFNQVQQRHSILMYDFHDSTDTKEQYTFYYTFLESKIIYVVCIYSTVHVPNLNSNYFKKG